MFPLCYFPGRFFAPRYWPPRRAPTVGPRPIVHFLFLSPFVVEELTMAGAARIDVPLRMVDVSDLRLQSQPHLDVPLHGEATIEVLLLLEATHHLLLEE